MCEASKCRCESDSILVLLKSVLIFHHWGFYGTGRIHGKSDGRALIFQLQMFVLYKEKWAETLDRGSCRREPAEGQDAGQVSSVWRCVLGWTKGVQLTGVVWNWWGSFKQL